MFVAAFDHYQNRGENVLTRPFGARGQGMSKEMSKIYFDMGTKALLRLRSQKSEKIIRIESRAAGYWMDREVRELRQQINWINAVLESRDCQVVFPDFE